MPARNEKRSSHETRAASKFPLRLMPSVRKVAEEFSRRDGVSLNQFINVAVAEKLAHLQHEEWLARRHKATPARISRALEILDRPINTTAAVGDDELPDGYEPIRKS